MPMGSTRLVVEKCSVFSLMFVQFVALRLLLAGAQGFLSRGRCISARVSLADQGRCKSELRSFLSRDEWVDTRVGLPPHEARFDSASRSFP